jgi:hypothetical protein
VFRQGTTPDGRLYVQCLRCASHPSPEVREAARFETGVETARVRWRRRHRCVGEGDAA